MLYRLCDWDSNFFGYVVAEILNEQGLSFEEVRRELSLKQIRLAYWQIPKSDHLALEKAHENASFVGTQVTYERTGHVDHFSNKRVIRYTPSSPTEELNQLAILCGDFSRFKNDRNISNERFEKLYLEWMKKCTEGALADEVLVSNEHGKTTGMVAIRKKEDSSGSIGLIAVSENSRGSGVGSELVYSALRASARQGCEKHNVVTYAENVAACRLFEKCGYSVKSTMCYFHLWL